MDCLFCKIINGEVPSYTIYEDDVVKVFLDVNPSSNGHSLVVPKKHCLDVNDVEPKVLTHIQKVVKDLIPKYQEKLHCEGMMLVQNNGYGQAIKHYHLHMIPRQENDGMIIKTNFEILDPKETYEKLK